MMFGHMLLLDCITSAVRYSMSTRLQPCHPKVLVPPPGSCTSVLLDRFMVVPCCCSASACACVTGARIGGGVGAGSEG